MTSTIQLKFTNLIETIPIEEGSHLSLSDLISLASSSFGVNFEKVKVYQELSDTGNPLLIDSNEVLNQTLNSSINGCILRLILDEPALISHKNDRKKKLEKRKRKEKKEKWIERKSRLAFEYGSKRLNEQHGTSITPEDLKIIFNRLDIQPFRLMRHNLLPRDFFKKLEEEKIETDDWYHVANETSSCNEEQGSMCHEFDQLLKLNETSDLQEDSNEEEEEKTKENKGKNRKEKHKKKCNADKKLKMFKRRWEKMFQCHGKHIPPMHPMMMMHYHPMMLGTGLPPPPSPFYLSPYHPYHHPHHHPHSRHPHSRHHHHKNNDYDENVCNESTYPPFHFHHPPPPPHHQFDHHSHLPYHHRFHEHHFHSSPRHYFHPFFSQQCSSQEGEEQVSQKK